VWPADREDHVIRIKIYTDDLFQLSGGRHSSIDLDLIKADLNRHRDVIQELARAKYRFGDTIVTLDLGELTKGQAAIASATRAEG
jgi:hypothetical protein